MKRVIPIEQIHLEFQIGWFGDLDKATTQYFLIQKGEELGIRIISFASDGIIVEPITKF